MRRGYCLGICLGWILMLGGVGAGWAAQANGGYDLTWCAFDTSGADQFGGPFHLVGAVGQPESGELGADPMLAVSGGFLPPLEPTIQILEPATNALWRIGANVSVHWRTDLAVAGDSVRLELWRGLQLLAVLGQDTAPAGDHVFQCRLPALAVGGGCHLRVVSTKLEILLNPNASVETAPLVTVAVSNAVEARQWALYE